MPEPTSQTPPTGTPPTGTTPPGVNLGTPPPATPPGAVVPPTGSETPPTSGDTWYKALVKDADNLKTVETKKWGDLEAVVKSYRELETAFSSKGAGATQAPSDPKEYVFNVPPELKDGYNAQFADTFRAVAHKAGISKEAAAAIHDGVLAYAKDSLATQTQSSTEAISKAVTSTKTALEQAWGADVTPAFARNLEMAKRAASQLDPALMQELRDVGAIVKIGNDEMIAKPAIFKALAKVGGQLFAEDTLFGPAAQNANPFDPKTTDMAAQAHLVRTDLARAKLLIRAAGPKVEAMFRHVLDGSILDKA